MGTVSSYKSFYPRAKCSCWFHNFSGDGFSFRTPGGPFSSLNVGRRRVLDRNSLTESPICVPSVPTSLSTLERIARAGFGIFRGPFSVPNPRRTVFEPKCWKITSFARNYLTGSPTCVPSVPTSLFTLERNRRAGFEVFRGLFPVPEPRRAVFEPMCWKVPCFARNSLTRSPICVPSVPTGLSTPERSPVRFKNFPVAVFCSAPPVDRFRAKVFENHKFRS